MRSVFETTVAQCIAEGFVSGQRRAADARLMAVGVNSQNSMPKENWERNKIYPSDAPRAVRQYLRVLVGTAYDFGPSPEGLVDRKIAPVFQSSTRRRAMTAHGLASTLSRLPKTTVTTARTAHCSNDSAAAIQIRTAGQSGDNVVAVRMWVSKSAIVTVRARKFFAFEYLRKEIYEQTAPRSSAAFIEALVARLTTRVQFDVADIATAAELFEAVLDDEASSPASAQPPTLRRVIRLRRCLEPQRAALTKLASLSMPLIPQTDALLLREWPIARPLR